MSCNICVETFNASSRSPINCSFCSFEVCSKCCKRYLVESIEDPHCMNCKKQWSRKFIVSSLDKTFVNTTLKKRREELLFEKERSLLPSTQVYVEEQIRKEEIDVEIDKIRRKISTLQEKLKSLQKEKNSIVNCKKSETEKKTFVRACPNNNCRGFLSKDWNCSLCNKQTCKECHEILDDEHKCDPGNVETAKLLSKDTKPCPKCGTQIFKIEGCNQMFCTQCHTAFSWNSGKIETGVIHNPHYFEWLRKNQNGVIQRNPGDILCGREIDNYFISVLNQQIRQYNDSCRGYTIDTIDKDLYGRLMEMCRNLIHIRLVELPKYQIDRIQNNVELRIKYMRNQITEDAFKKTIQKREKDISKRNEISDILRMFVSCSTDIIYRLRNDIGLKQPLHMLLRTINELKELTQHINNCFREVHEVYNTSRIYNIDLDTLHFL